MTRLSNISALFLLISFSLILPASASVQKIGPDLYAYISQNDSSANSTFLVSDRGILVVDTGLNPEEGRKLLLEIRKISPAPIRWIVNTHYHPDHRGGNDVVGPETVVITTEQTRDAALKPEGDSRAARGKLPPGYALNETFTGTSGPTLFVGGHEVRVYHPGPAHTMGDAVVYFPDLHAIATGDLFLRNSCPAMDQGDLENWVKALDAMLALPVEHIVPGHFKLATRKDLQHFRNYLAALRDQVKAMFDRGMSLEQVKQDLHLDAYKDLRQFPQYEATFTDNAQSYYQQLSSRKK